MLCFHKAPRKIAGQRGGWIYGLWAGAYPGFMLPTISLPSTPCEWVYYFLLVYSLFCGWLYDWNFLLALPLDLGSQGEPGLATEYIPLHLSELQTSKCIAFKVMVTENYLTKCMLIFTVYFNTSKVCVSCNKEWRMNHNFSLFLTILHHKKIANICIWQITWPYKPPSAYFIETMCHLSIQPWWQ